MNASGPPPAAPPRSAREAGCLAMAALVLFPAIVWGFSERLGLPLVDAIFLAGLLELLPALTVAQVPLIMAGDAGREDGAGGLERMPVYASSAVTVLVVGGVALTLGWSEPGVAAMGFRGPATGNVVLWTAAVLASVGVVVGGFHLAMRHFDWRESPILRRLLPRTGREKAAFTGVSFAAGVGEEAAYRGYAIPVLAPVLGGAWSAALFSSAVFGLLHAYQGPIGMARTGLMGLVLAASFVISGSLWPAIVAHVAVDLVGGLWIGDRLT